MSEWNTELDAFFAARWQQDHSHEEPLVADPAAAAMEFIAAVAMPAFENFGAALQKHGRHVHLRRGDASIRITVEYADTEEFDFTLWGGQYSLSTDSRAHGRHELGRFQNAKGTNLQADTTQDDIGRHLTDKYIAMNSGPNR